MTLCSFCQLKLCFGNSETESEVPNLIYSSLPRIRSMIIHMIDSRICSVCFFRSLLAAALFTFSQQDLIHKPLFSFFFFSRTYTSSIPIPFFCYYVEYAKFVIIVSLYTRLSIITAIDDGENHSYLGSDLESPKINVLVLEGFEHSGPNIHRAWSQHCLRSYNFFLELFCCSKLMLSIFIASHWSSIDCWLISCGSEKHSREGIFSFWMAGNIK